MLLTWDLTARVMAVSWPRATGLVTAASGCNAACLSAGGGSELLHQAGGEAEGGVPQGEGKGPHQAAGHGLRHLPERGHDRHVSPLLGELGELGAV